MRYSFRQFWLILLVMAPSLAMAADRHDYAAQADEVTQYIQQKFYDSKSGLYLHSIKERHAEFMWGDGIEFSALVAASRYHPDVYQPIMDRFFKSLDRYWDYKEAIPGYEPAPGNGNGNDKYYDDNEWMVLTFVEAYELTHDQRYLQRATPTLKFALSGWDDQLGGGIWWHEGHKGGGKNTCSNAPAAEGCVRLAKYLSHEEAKADVEMAVKIVDWTSSHLQNDSGLFGDSENATTEKKNGGQLTYNTALMIRANLGLYRWTGDAKYLTEAKREAKASDWFVDKKTNAYRDSVKWSHLMVEADLEMYRATHEEYLLTRARNNAEHFYTSWKSNPPTELIDNASIARLLWLMADSQSETGKNFWNRADKTP